MKGIIYKWTNQINGKSYIGQTTKPDLRYYTHTHSSHSDKFHNALRYYGLMNFEYKVLEECEEEDLDKREIYWIRYYNSVEEGYNIKYGGDGSNLRELKKDKSRYGGGKILFGYVVDENKHFKVDESLKDVIVSCFEEYSQGKVSQRQVVKKYNITKNRNFFRRKQYAGFIKGYPQIVPVELFNKCQEVAKTGHTNV